MKKYVNTSSVAILMSTYNGEYYLKEQLDSIIIQTYKDWTLYVRDDNSSDLTRTILREYMQVYDNIVMFDDEKINIGVKNNFLRLLEVVESPYYMFCDQDDVWLPDKMELSMERLHSLEHLYSREIPLLVHTDVIVVDDELNVIAKSRWDIQRIDPVKLQTFDFLLMCTFILGMTMCFNHKVKNVCFPVSPYAGMHDSWISPLVAKYGIVSNILTPTVLYRQHQKNVYGVKKETFMDKCISFRRVYLLNKEKFIRLKRMEGYSFRKFIRVRMHVLLIRMLYKHI